MNRGGNVFADSVVKVEVDRLAGIVAQVLEPVVAGLPADGDESGDEQAPGEEPDEVEEPVRIPAELVVVVRVAQAEEAQEMFVDEVEVEEAVNVADGGMVADRVSLVGVGEAAEDVPGRGDGEEQRKPVTSLSLRQRRHWPVRMM